MEGWVREHDCNCNDGKLISVIEGAAHAALASQRPRTGGCTQTLQSETGDLHNLRNLHNVVYITIQWDSVDGGVGHGVADLDWRI